MATAQATKNNITLKGSTAIVTEFFGYAVNSILYQRGIYPPESFERKNKYGLGMLVTTDEQLKAYLVNVLQQINDWMLQKTLQKLVLVVTAVGSHEVLERWVFDIVNEDANVDERGDAVGEKSDKEIQTEISAIIRQITASVTFLPLLEEQCTFDLLVYTNDDAEVPVQWEDPTRGTSRTTPSRSSSGASARRCTRWRAWCPTRRARTDDIIREEEVLGEF